MTNNFINDNDDCIEQVGVDHDGLPAELLEEQGDFGPLSSDSILQSDPASARRTSRLPSGGTEAQDWRLICPPANWREPIPIDLGELRLLEILTQRLNLVVTRDDKRKKLYLGTAYGLAPRSRLTGDGGYDGSATAPNGADEPSQNSPPRSGLRFGNGWIAEVVPDGEAGPEYKAPNPAIAAPLIRAFPDHQLSKNFRLSEFRPGEHSYDFIRLSPMLVHTLEEIRQRAGGYPLHITSGYRPPAYNRKVGGVSNSIHMNGLAADIYSDHMNVDDLHHICDQVIGDRGGVGYYPVDKFVHVDLRGSRARW